MEEVFSAFSSQPIAAASLGQVYRARLRDSGREVAVKVQRPGALIQVALDIYLLRRGLAITRRLLKIKSDLPALADEWGFSLYGTRSTCWPYGRRQSESFFLI